MKSLTLIPLFIILVSCGQNKGSSPNNNPVIFISSTQANGNFGGPSQADAICMADASRPDKTKTYKAMMSIINTRIACQTAYCTGGTSENINWVLSPNTTYTRSDGTIIGTTNSAGIFPATLTNSFSSTNTKIWTGLKADWTQWFDEDCNDWTSQNGFNNGARGVSNNSDYRSWALARDNCNVAGSFYCVEQI